MELYGFMLRSSNLGIYLVITNILFKPELRNNLYSIEHSSIMLCVSVYSTLYRNNNHLRNLWRNNRNAHDFLFVFDSSFQLFEKVILEKLTNSWSIYIYTLLDLTWPWGSIVYAKNLNKLCPNVFDFCKNFGNAQTFFSLNPQTFCLLLFYIVQREDI